MIRRAWSALQDAWYSPALVVPTMVAVAVMVTVGLVA